MKKCEMRRTDKVNSSFSKFIKGEIVRAASEFNVPEEEIVKFHNDPKSNKTKIVDITISNFSDDYGNVITCKESIKEIDDNTTQITYYKYMLADKSNKSEFFRFDLSDTIPIKYPNAHLNVDFDTYGKDHITYPKDSDINFWDLTLTKFIRIVEEYNCTKVNPAKDRGEPYAAIVNL